MNEVISRCLGLFGMVWMIVFFICSLRYSFGDRKHVQTLVRKLARNPNWYLEDKGIIMISGISAGGLLAIYSFIYPFVVRRSVKRGYKLDIMMWLHWLWWMVFSYAVIVELMK
ncbi:hypothetical protein VR7878_00384 [Vibrio ruber DSM 16370]|uniref:Uncharacterized protein n=1 Tax=Vibrio ruber (strain DSM 16370 / JCM 11486 / BCRC 17186 / CECT 7878 / LMG 23124 / VR1) TaxID=1123498 RepID=A0A1R4LAI3_VIBR1|nr:hypothetical protein [Vibrio ruber]SJN53566.1 hypothetical protein VR7878_00384 [Vibrio ruber DSM 16370]